MIQWTPPVWGSPFSMFHVKHLGSAMGACPPQWCRTTQARTEGTTQGPVPAHKRQHKWGRSQSRSPCAGNIRTRFPSPKGVHRGEGVPAKPSFRLCEERRSKGANAAFAVGGNGVSGLCDDERASLVTFSRVRESNPRRRRAPQGGHRGRKVIQ